MTRSESALLKSGEGPPWFVCYCAPRRTLPLVKALGEAGRAVECPAFRFRRRLPRHNKACEVVRPLIGGVFFCRQDSWPLGQGIVAGVDLAAVRRMIWMGEPALVSGEELDRLFAASQRRTAAKTNFSATDRVVLDLGPFKGAKAVVERKAGAQLVLCVEGMRFPLTVDPLLVRAHEQ